MRRLSSQYTLEKTKDGSGDSELGDDGNKWESMLAASHFMSAPVLTDHTTIMEYFWESVAAGYM